MSKVKKPRSKKTKKPLTRKEQRKQRVLQKKEQKRLFFSNNTLKTPVGLDPKKLKKYERNRNSKPLVLAPPRSLPVELQENERFASDDSIPSDFSDEEVDDRLKGTKFGEKQPKISNSPKKCIKMQSSRPNVEDQHRIEVQRQKDLEKMARKQRLKLFREQNEEEDEEIARLEKKLKLNRSKDKNRLVRKMFNDGLDYAFDLFLDDDEERAKLELKEKRKKSENEAHWSEEEELNEDEYDEMHSLDNDGDDDNSDYVGGSDQSDGNSDDNNSLDDDHNEPTYEEDIYGRKRDKDGNIIVEQSSTSSVKVEDEATETGQKYMPPHLRAKLVTKKSNNGEQLDRLRKQCKGFLNRLSETNLHKISTGIEDLYMNNSRYNMNETLTKLLNESLIARTMTKERMVQEHMVLLAYLHAHIGSEIGAHFLQNYIEQFNTFVNNDKLSELAIEDKRLNNIVLLLSYMYIFKIYEHRLLIEIIDKLAQHLCEKTIECMLLIFQSVGFKLRKDDPVSFKEMTNNVQQRIAAAPLEIKENSRLKFMVETLNAVKHNNINKIPQFDPELAENLRKRLKAMLRNEKYVTTLNITMEDLLRADQVGKWWVVGSAWSGNITDLGAAQKSNMGSTDGNSSNRFIEKLVKLAKQQQMNTEERRNIFCIIMSAEDYVNAFEKILRLALKDQRAIAYVIIHCCLNEACPNPYYAHLALKFCNFNRKFQLAFQFATWDRINDIEALSKQQIKNLAHFLEHLIINSGLQLSVLKVVDFLQLQKSSFLLMRDVMVGLLLHSNEREVYGAFERLANNPKVHQFKNSLRLFMQHFLLKEKDSKLKLSEERLSLLTKRIDYVDRLLAYIDL